MLRAHAIAAMTSRPPAIASDRRTHHGNPGIEPPYAFPDPDVTWKRNSTVTPLTAIEQALTSGVPTYLVRQAITTAHKKAMIRDADRRRLNAHLTRKVS
jgi:hypothetical protein